MGIVESGSHAYPLKVDFNREVTDQEYDGLSKLNLHPSTDDYVTIDEDLSYGAMRDFGTPTARTGWAKVTVNGEQLGLYATVEQMNGDFLRCHIAIFNGMLSGSYGESALNNRLDEIS